MGHESTMICLDNSEWTRNGDYSPTRLDAQNDAASMICQQKTGQNPENTVGVLTTAGNGVELLLSPTEDMGKLLACFSRIKIGGKSNLSTSIKIAKLALKHRKNTAGDKRIILFVGSPVDEKVEALIKLGDILRKDNIFIDIISIGEIEENNDVLGAFIKAVNKQKDNKDTSHLFSIPAGLSISDAILSSPILGGDGHSSSSGGQGGGFDEYGFDPESDPELAMAMRVSIEEARAEEEARNKVTTIESNRQDSDISLTPVPENTSEFGGDAAFDEEDEDALLQRAIKLSIDDGPVISSSISNEEVTLQEGSGEEDEDEDAAALQMALAMSMSQQERETNTNTTILNPDFASQLLSSVNADQSNPIIQAALEQLLNSGSSNASKDTKKDDENNKKRKGDE